MNDDDFVNKYYNEIMLTNEILEHWQTRMHMILWIKLFALHITVQTEQTVF
jgi:hypothetical protein